MKRTLTFGEMKEIQDKLNEHTVPDWKKTLRVNNFKVAMFDEFSELLNSSHWKWWKNADIETNLWNMKIEAVDILHFALSIYILGQTSNVTNEAILGEFNADHNYMIGNDGHIDHSVFINKAINVLTSINPTNIEMLFESLGMTAEEISAIYVAKSELNFIRQDSGYKTGKYVKIVDGIEDNERMKTIVETYMFDGDRTLDDLRAKIATEFFQNLAQ